jgi:hypothetical protein
VVQQFNADGLLFPVRVRTGAHKGELAWMSLQHWRVLPRTLLVMGHRSYPLPQESVTDRTFAAADSPELAGPTGRPCRVIVRDSPVRSTSARIWSSCAMASVLVTVFTGCPVLHSGSAFALTTNLRWPGIETLWNTRVPAEIGVKGKTPKWDARDVIAIVIAAIAIITLFLLPISVLPLRRRWQASSTGLSSHWFCALGGRFHG